MVESRAVRFHQGDPTLKKNSKGEIVSVTKSKQEKANPWIKAVAKAKKALVKSGDMTKKEAGGFVLIKGKLLTEARKIYGSK
jgi:hypothetical protein